MANQLKIATWNLERPTATSKNNSSIISILKKLDADILVLTETNAAINPGAEYIGIATTDLHANEVLDKDFYKKGENRTTIWTKHPVKRQLTTCDGNTAVCAVVITPMGELTIYGTIIGVFGNRDKGFKTELIQQIEDYKRIARKGNVCIAGDFNLTFTDNYYYTAVGRQKLNEYFLGFKVQNLTQLIPENIDHIAISKTFIDGKTITLETWNEDKRLSDHIGVCATIRLQ
jgi:endonuclease/exonuclease/phosphatase family metal-dependent hydrolase